MKPLQSLHLSCAEPAIIAQALLWRILCTPSGAQGLYEHRGQLHVWYGGRWQTQDHAWLRRTCWTHLRDATFAYEGRDGPERRRLVPDRHLVANVCEALDAAIQLPYATTPCWLRGSTATGEGGEERVWAPLTRAETSVTFQDAVVDVHAGAPHAHERDEHWFEPVVLPCRWEPDAPCTRWHQCLQEWSGGDPTWCTLLQRMMGYALLPHRRLRRWFLLHGKVAGGKSTICKVMEALLGPAFVGTSLSTLSDRFGLDGAYRARALCINEVTRLDSREGQRVAQVVKTSVGQDLVDVNVKNRAYVRNVRLPFVVWMVSNLIPQLPNEGQGLSSKMVILPFEHSFQGREDEHLIDTLHRELPGIAAWALQGAQELEATPSLAGKFPTPTHATEAADLYLKTNNPFDSFLSARFQQDQQGFVSTEVLWREYTDWKASNFVVGPSLSRNHLPARITQESSWDLRRHRIHGGTRGLLGLSRRLRPEDEV